MAAQVVTTTAPASAPTHAEAPASATVKAVDPGGFEWLLTVRSDTTRELIDRAAVLSTWLADHGWQPATRSARAQLAQAGDTGEPPSCPTHNRPMQRGKRGDWYCPVKVADDDGTGKPVYCKQRR